LDKTMDALSFGHVFIGPNHLGLFQMPDFEAIENKNVIIGQFNY
jgi:hypothetical protein